MGSLLRNLLLNCLVVVGGFAQVVVTTGSDLGGAGLSLREAVASSGVGETILFEESLSGEFLDLSQGEIVISKNLTIEGLGADDFISIQGNNSSRLFRIAEGAHLTLRFIALSEGMEAADYGGAILNEGTLTIQDCRISNCRATSGGAIFNAGMMSCLRTGFVSNLVNSPGGLELGGGAILSTGTTTLSHCHFINNVASGIIYGGGAVHCRKSSMHVSECLFRDNRTAGSGGAIFNSAILEVNSSTFDDNLSLDDGAALFNEAKVTEEPVEATVQTSTFIFNQSGSDSGAIHLSRDSQALIENCTIAENVAQDGGGAIENSQGFVTISACTIASNRARQRGGGIFTLGQTILKNSILSGNRISVGTNDLERFDLPAAVFIPVGANLIEELGNSEIADNADPSDGPDLILSDSALLLPLGSYGGPNLTMPPQLNSPALDAAVGSTLDIDQRGSTRFFDPTPDIGAVEFLGVFNELYFDSDLDGISNGVEVVTGTDPLVKDLEHPGHLKITTANGITSLSFGYVRSTSNRYVLRILRSADLNGEEEEILSSRNFFIPNSIETPFILTDETAPENRAFYRLEAIRR